MRSRGRWQTPVKIVAGFILGLAIWWGLTPLYNSVLATVTQPVLRTFESPSITRLRPEDREIIVDREDFPPRSAQPGIPADDLTFNIILLTTLFATSRETFSNRNVTGYLIASLLLFVTHVLGLIAEVESIYALKLGPWSLANYGAFARNFWGAAAHFNRLVGLYAFAFALWWLMRPDRPDAEPAAPRRKRGRRRS